MHDMHGRPSLAFALAHLSHGPTEPTAHRRVPRVRAAGLRSGDDRAARARHRAARQGRPGRAPALRRHVDGGLTHRPRLSAPARLGPGARNRASASDEIDSTSRSSCDDVRKDLEQARRRPPPSCVGPRLTRKPDVFGKPICSRTGEASSGCPEQSEPAASRIPRSSSAIISVAGSRPSTLKQTRCGARCVGWPWTRAPGTSAAMRSRRRPVSVQSRAARSAMSASDAVSAAAIDGDARRVLHARSPLALAVVAARVRGDAHAAPDVERADARRPAELVGREREQVDLERLDVHREPADRLAGVGVEPDVRLARQAGGLGDLLQRAELVVRVLDAREQRAGRADLGGVPVHVDASVGVDRHHHDLEPVALEHVAHAADRGMLRRADHDAGAQLADRAHAAPDRERDRLGAAGREHELVRLRVDRPATTLARVVDDAVAPARPGPWMFSGSPNESRARHQRVARRGQERRGRRRVEVDVPWSCRVRLPLGSASDARVTAWRVPCPSGTAPSTRRRRGSPPATGPTIHTYQSSHWPAASAGPNQRAGLNAAPVHGPIARMPNVSVSPMVSPAVLRERAAVVDRSSRTPPRPGRTSRSPPAGCPCPTRCRRRASGCRRTRRRTPARGTRNFSSNAPATRPEQLRAEVDERSRGRHLPGHPQRHLDRGVEHAAGQVRHLGDHDRDHQAVRQRHAHQVELSVEVQDDGSRPEEDQGERPDELRDRRLAVVLHGSPSPRSSSRRAARRSGGRPEGSPRAGGPAKARRGCVVRCPPWTSCSSRPIPRRAN